MNREEQLAMGITLQHEAHRDGIVTADNHLETRTAVLSHTAIALRMANDNRYTASMNAVIAGNTTLQNDLNAYFLSKNPENAGVWEAYVDGMYDSSGDFWKVTKEGQLIWDGKWDLYDENDRLLKKTDEQTLYGSFASAMGITKDEAKRILESDHYNISFKDKRIISLADGKDRTNDLSFQFETTSEFKAAYNFQMNYADQVATKYGGSMAAAVTAYQNDIQQKLELGRIAGSIDPVAMAGYGMMSGLNSFAYQYDATLYGERYGSFGTPGLLNQERNKQYSQPAIAQAFAQIKSQWSLTNSNPMYSLIGDGKVIDPVAGRDRISVFSQYDDGRKHGWQGGLAIDLATAGQNHPLYTTQTEMIFLRSNPLRWQDSSNPLIGYGYHLTTYTDDFQLIYGHLQADTYASKQLLKVIQSGQIANLFRLSLPAGYQFGNVGNTGNSFGAHLHWEFRPRW